MSQKVTRCTRCNRRLRSDNGWNMTVRAGRVVEVTCPTCQSPEENAEAVINEATLDYAFDILGRLCARPKQDDDAAA